MLFFVGIMCPCILLCRFSCLQFLVLLLPSALFFPLPFLSRFVINEIKKICTVFILLLYEPCRIWDIKIGGTQRMQILYHSIAMVEYDSTAPFVYPQPSDKKRPMRRIATMKGLHCLVHRVKMLQNRINRSCILVLIQWLQSFLQLVIAYCHYTNRMVEDMNSYI